MKVKEKKNFKLLITKKQVESNMVSGDVCEKNCKAKGVKGGRVCMPRANNRVP